MKARTVGIIGVAASFAFGAALGTLVLDSRPDPDSPASTPPTGTHSSARPTGRAGEADQTPQGARAAAIVYATASQDWLYLNDAEMSRAVGSIATTDVAQSLSAETVARLAPSRDALATSTGRVWWLVRPLATKVEHFDGATAQVSVWTVTILSAAGVAIPQADWARVSLDLSWQSGAWRASSVTSAPGPTPVVGTRDRPWEPETLDEALAGFERVASGDLRP